MLNPSYQWSLVSPLISMVFGLIPYPLHGILRAVCVADCGRGGERKEG